MVTRTYGYLYDRNRSVTDDAANIRRHIKTMSKAGVLPADWSYSVRKRSGTHSWAFNVRAVSPRPLCACEPDHYDHPHVRHAETGEMVTAREDRYTIEARAVARALHDLVNGHNHDGSDTLTDYYDVKFYSDVTLTTAPGVAETLETPR